MPQPPNIIVQIIHIEGPLKGRIQELNQPQLEIGRHKSCQIKFPADITVISRKHATIVRDGNRFKIIDHSGNGTLVNSQPIKEEYLKDGDVITVAPGGPKFSFLTEIKPGSASLEPAPPAEPAAEPVKAAAPVQQPAPPPPQPEPEPAAQPLPDYQPPPAKPEPVRQPPPEVEAAPAPAPPAASEKLISPFVVQYGPTINSFDSLPITIGRHPSCEFIIEKTGILEHQAQINFHNSQFYLEDRTGQQRVLVNGSPIQQETVLQHNDEITLSATGPFFRFLEGGRLVEIEKEPVVEPEKQENETASDQDQTSTSPSRKIKSLFDKFLKH